MMLRVTRTLCLQMGGMQSILSRLVTIHSCYCYIVCSICMMGNPWRVGTHTHEMQYPWVTGMGTTQVWVWVRALVPMGLPVQISSAKPDALTRHWDISPKEGDKDYTRVNPHNFWPVFMQEQLAASLRATYLAAPVLRSSTLFDVEILHNDILFTLPSDPLAAIHMTNSKPSNSHWTIDSNSFLQLNDCMYIPDSNDLHLQVLQYKHDHSLSRHFGQNQTLELICCEYTWPGVWIFVKDYVSSCTSCACAKVPRHKPYELLMQLLIPEKPWNSTSMDFIEQLPLSSRYTTILMVVDWLSKQCIFIPMHNTITSLELAKLFLLHVFSKHRVSSCITSDWGSGFISHFFCSLNKGLDIQLHFTCGYHLEGDSQTERMNQTLEQYLQIYCNYQQDNWSELLPLVEFAYNNTPSATTRVSPFFANKGYHPNITIHPEHDLTSAQAHEYSIDLNSLHEFLHEKMAHIQQWYQGPADARQTLAPDFKVSDQVFVKAKYFCSMWPSKKLSKKNLGPYTIIAQAGSHSFTLQLPDSMNSVHPIFHVSQLEPSIPNTIPNWVQSLPPPIEVDGEPEYEISEILDSKIDCWWCNCKLPYLVCWSGYEGTDDETSWLLATELSHASELMHDYHLWYPNKPRPHST